LKINFDSITFKKAVSKGQLFYFGVYGLVFGVWCLVFGVWCLEPLKPLKPHKPLKPVFA
jgi:hypothetical protein